MKELQVFSYEGNEVRTVDKSGEVWWVLKDVCSVLDIANSRDAAARLDEDEKDDVGITDAIGRKQKTTVISESGLYNVIMLSRKPEAKMFKRWVTHDVLPSIRKHGGYIATNPDDTDADIMAKAVLIAQKTIDEQKSRISALHEQIECNQPKVLFADAVSVSNSTILIGELAKILKQNGVEIGQNRLFEKLRNDGFLIRRKGTDYNAPTQKSMELGLFKVKETAVARSNGSVTINKTTKVTGKGQQYFVNMFLGRAKSSVM